MDDEMRATALFRKTVMFRVELMTIKSESEFHGEIIRKSGRFGYLERLNHLRFGRESGRTNLRHAGVPGRLHLPVPLDMFGP